MFSLKEIQEIENSTNDAYVAILKHFTKVAANPKMLKPRVWNMDECKIKIETNYVPMPSARRIMTFQNMRDGIWSNIDNKEYLQYCVSKTTKLKQTEYVEKSRLLYGNVSCEQVNENVKYNKTEYCTNMYAVSDKYCNRAAAKRMTVVCSNTKNITAEKYLPRKRHRGEHNRNASAELQVNSVENLLNAEEILNTSFSSTQNGDINTLNRTFKLHTQRNVFSNEIKTKNNNSKVNDKDLKISEETSNPDLSVMSGINKCFIQLLIIDTGSKKVHEFIVEKKIYEQLRLKIPEIIPNIDVELELPYTFDALLILFKSILYLPYNVTSREIALQVLHMCEKYHIYTLKSCLQNFLKNKSASACEEFFEYSNVSCTITSTFYVEPTSYTITLHPAKQSLKSVFRVDIRNELVFEAVKGKFCITGIQLKLNTGSVIAQQKINIMIDITKDNKKLLSEMRVKSLTNLIFINFKRKFSTIPLQKIKVSILIEDIIGAMLLSRRNMKINHISNGHHFKVFLKTNSNAKDPPLIFIEKFFYTYA